MVSDPWSITVVVGIGFVNVELFLYFLKLGILVKAFSDKSVISISEKEMVSIFIFVFEFIFTLASVFLIWLFKWSVWGFEFILTWILLVYVLSWIFSWSFMVVFSRSL